MLADYRTAPIDARLRAILAFIEKLTVTPDAVGPADIEPLRAAGIDDEAIEDAIDVCADFNLIDRIADAMAFHVGPPSEFAADAKTLLKRGYKL